MNTFFDITMVLFWVVVIGFLGAPIIILWILGVEAGIEEIKEIIQKHSSEEGD